MPEPLGSDIATDGEWLGSYTWERVKDPDPEFVASHASPTARFFEDQVRAVISRLSGLSELSTSRDLRRLLCDGPTDLSSHWLDATGARVLAQESGRHLESDEASTVSDAYATRKVGSLVAVVNDALVIEDEAYVLDASPQDLVQLSRELGGVNFVLMDHTGTCCILFTVDDFKLVAGPLSFVSQVAGEPSAARESFEEFSADQLEGLQSAIRRASSYMTWVGNAE